MKPIELGTIPTFLISRLSAIGDCIETLPVVNALKTRWPACKIVWLVDCGADQLLRGQQGIDQVVRAKKGFLFRSAERKEVIQRLRESAIDVAIDPQGLLKSSLASWLSGAKVRIGFDSSVAREGASFFYTHRVRAKKEHLVDKQLELLHPLDPSGFHRLIEPVRFDFQPNADALEFSRRFLQDAGLKAKEYWIVNPGASCSNRRWPIERFAEVASEVHRQTQIRSVIIWGGDQERAMAETILQRASSQSERSCILAPPTNLMELSALIHQSRMIVTGDTGPMHMAVASNVPCVALFGTTLPSQSGPYGPKHIKIRNETETNPKVLRKAKDNRSICKIEVHEVVEACLQSLCPTSYPLKRSP